MSESYMPCRDLELEVRQHRDNLHALINLLHERAQFPVITNSVTDLDSQVSNLWDKEPWDKWADWDRWFRWTEWDNAH